MWLGTPDHRCNNAPISVFWGDEHQSWSIGDLNIHINDVYYTILGVKLTLMVSHLMSHSNTGRPFDGVIGSEVQVGSSTRSEAGIGFSMCSGVAQRWSCFGIVLKMRVSRRSWGFLNHLLLTAKWLPHRCNQQCRSKCIIWSYEILLGALFPMDLDQIILCQCGPESTLTWKSWLIPICTTHLMVYSYGQWYQRTVRRGSGWVPPDRCREYSARQYQKLSADLNLLLISTRICWNGLHAHVPILLLSENRLWWELKLSCTHRPPNRKGTRPNITWEPRGRGRNPSWRWSGLASVIFFHAHLFSDQT